jgi:hypothetical protein
MIMKLNKEPYFTTYSLDRFHKWNSSICISQKCVFSVRLHLEELYCEFCTSNNIKYNGGDMYMTNGIICYWLRFIRC